MRVRTAALILTRVLGFLTVSLPAEAQKAGKVYRIAFLSPQLYPFLTLSLIEVLRERG